MSDLKRQMASPSVFYAKPREVADLNQCYFYHTMEIPGYGLVTGQWDLRESVRRYTGGVDFRGKRVLEVGTASGFLCFSMEHEGAEVVAYDLSEDQSWDLVPYAQVDTDLEAENRRNTICAINRGYWLAHKAFKSKARVVYGTVYDIPVGIGTVDVSTFCSVLTHVRDPFLALVNAARLTRDTILVTELVSEDALATVGQAPTMEFLPKFRKGQPIDGWWCLNPGIITQFLGVLGFQDTEVTFHTQQSVWGGKSLFSVVGRRTVGGPRESE